VACSAVVTEDATGRDANHATIFFRGGKQEPKRVTLEKFIEDYALTIEDSEEAEATGHIARFENIGHAVIESDSRFFEYVLTLIDSPGLEYRDTCAEIASGHLSKADAVIYTLRADALFTKTDKEHLRKTYGCKNPNNVFFVINRINQVSDVEDVKDTTKAYLKGIFKDESGSFNAKLYNRRVFFVNALGAYEGKLPGGDRKKYETSGVPEFEAELERFLLSGERYTAALQTVVALMADSYVRTKKTIKPR
jgi:hypothetical protein